MSAEVPRNDAIKEQTAPEKNHVTAPTIDAGAIDHATIEKSEKEIKKEKLDAASSECTQVTDYLYVCGEDVAKDFDCLIRNGITHVINASGINLDNFHDATGQFEYLKLNLLDHRSQDISWFFMKAVAHIHKCRNAGGKCVVHCTQGVSRSCTLIIAYLIIVESMTYNEGFAFVKERRKVASPNCGFICNLLELEKFCHFAMCNGGEGEESDRLFALLPHAAEDRNTWVPKVAMNSDSRKTLPPTLDLLDDRTSYVLVGRGMKLVVWDGSRSGTDSRNDAKEFASQVNEFLFKGKGTFLDFEGGGKELFRTCTGADDGEKDAQVAAGADLENAQNARPSYIDSFGWIGSEDVLPCCDVNASAEAGAGAVAGAGAGAGSGAGAGAETSTTPTESGKVEEDEEAGSAAAESKLFQCVRGDSAAAWKWERINVYDDQDLAEDCLFALLSSQEKVTHVWVGKEFSGLGEGQDTSSFVREVQWEGSQESEDPDGTLASGSFLLEQQFSESDDFWDLFEAGY